MEQEADRYLAESPQGGGRAAASAAQAAALAQAPASITGLATVKNFLNLKLLKRFVVVDIFTFLL